MSVPPLASYTLLNDLWQSTSEPRKGRCTNACFDPHQRASGPELAAVEYASHNIRVNAIAPGSTLTSMMEQWKTVHPQIEERLNRVTPLGRMASPLEVAQAALWLCSDAASYVTGVVLPVDCGFVVP